MLDGQAKHQRWHLSQQNTLKSALDLVQFDSVMILSPCITECAEGLQIKVIQEAPEILVNPSKNH